MSGVTRTLYKWRGQCLEGMKVWPVWVTCNVPLSKQFFLFLINVKLHIYRNHVKKNLFVPKYIFLKIRVTQ